MTQRCCSTAILISLALASASAHADWPRFRGPQGNGIANEANDWDPAVIRNPEAILWATNVGVGYSAVAVADGKAYTVGNAGKVDTLYCLDPVSGRPIWTHSYDCGPGSYPGPRATPAIAEGKAYMFSREGHVLCVDAATGKPIWERDLPAELDAKNLTWGFSASPVVDGQRLLLNANSSGVALDKDTGQTLWSSPPGPSSYAAPVIHEYQGRRTLFLFGCRDLFALQPEDGKVLWSWPWQTAHNVNAADPIALRTFVFISSGYKRGCALLDFASGKPSLVWESKIMANHFSTCLLIDGRLYGIDGNAGKGVLRCIEYATGNQKWEHDTGFGSLIAVGDRLVVLTEDGTLHIAPVSPESWQPAASARVLTRPKCWTAPTYAQGLLFCRNSQGDIVCIRLRP